MLWMHAATRHFLSREPHPDIRVFNHEKAKVNIKSIIKQNGVAQKQMFLAKH